jgi:hypothetical protein
VKTWPWTDDIKHWVEESLGRPVIAEWQLRMLNDLDPLPDLTPEVMDAWLRG